MEPTIVPEPSGEERRAILAALGEDSSAEEAPVYASRWRKAALGEAAAAADGDEEPSVAVPRPRADEAQATAPVRKRRGASRA